MTEANLLPSRPVEFRRWPGMGLRAYAEDRRDRHLYAAVPNINLMPDRSDVGPLLPPVLDQSVTSACTGYSVGGFLHGVMVKDGHRRPFVPSPVDLYRGGRVLGGYVDEDGGAELRLVMKHAATFGLPPMSNIRPSFDADDLADPATGLFPEGSVWRRPPAPSHVADAARRTVLVYYRLPTLNDMLQCLSEGWPLVFGFKVFRSLYGDDGPRFEVPDPGLNDRELGGHAVIGRGHDKPSRRMICRNSWGKDAHQGRPDFTLSFDYILRHAADAWTARRIKGFKV